MKACAVWPMIGRSGARLQDAAGGLVAVHHRHLDVHQHDVVGLGTVQLRTRSTACAPSSDHHQAGAPSSSRLTSSIVD
jgi:hypothetical protein